jgi:hypothetical protein
MAKFKYTIENGYANCTIEDEIEFDDSFLEQLSEFDREIYIENEIKDEVFGRIDWNYREIKND